MNKPLLNKVLIGVVGLAMLAGCRADGNDPGIEYAPQMYHSIPYEPLSTLTEEGVPSGPIASFYYEDFINALPYNEYDGKKPINMLKPVPGTVSRQYYPTVQEAVTPQPEQELMLYDLHKDSLDLAAATLKNPLPETEDVVAEGKALYLSFCAPCHGANGQGNGKVGGVYLGVPNYTVGRYATLNEGHIFHVITHGKGRMWPHGSQMNPEERWKIVRYVQKLQKGES